MINPYYAAAPFIGAFLSFVLVKESLSPQYLAALFIMIAETAFVVRDTLCHAHTHYLTDEKHEHHHSNAELEKLLTGHYSGGII